MAAAFDAVPLEGVPSSVTEPSMVSFAPLGTRIIASVQPLPRVIVPLPESVTAPLMVTVPVKTISPSSLISVLHVVSSAHTVAGSRASAISSASVTRLTRLPLRVFIFSSVRVSFRVPYDNYFRTSCIFV